MKVYDLTPEQIAKAQRVSMHPIEKDFHDEYSENFNAVDRRPYELVRMQHDRALQANREHAAAPYIGETPQQYDRRLTQQQMKHATTYPVMGTLQKVDGKLYRDMQATIMREALQAPARRGELVPIKFTDSAGRVITEYEGTMDWLNQFKAPVEKGDICYNGKACKPPVGIS
jgi:hypothetical protein